MRCSGCDSILSRTERKVKNKHTGDYEDLCRQCRVPAKQAVYDNEGEDGDLYFMDHIFGMDTGDVGGYIRNIIDKGYISTG